jgi:hypothetical protein
VLTLRREECASSSKWKDDRRNELKVFSKSLFPKKFTVKAEENGDQQMLVTVVICAKL